MAVLPVYNIVTLPGTTIYFKNETYTKSTGKAPEVGERVTIIVSKKDVEGKIEQTDFFYPIGVSGKIGEVGNNGYMSIQISHRVNVEDVSLMPDDTLDVSISRRMDLEDLDEENAAARLKELKTEVIRLSEGYEWAPVIRGYAASWKRIEEMAAAYSPWMMSTNEEKYAALAEDSKQKRFELLERMLYENLEITKVQNQASDAQEQEYKKMYRESAIRKQMEYLQKELDEMHPENVTDLRRLEIKLSECGMNEDAYREGEKILRRLKSEGQHSAETGMLMDYLDFLTDLPWKKEGMERIVMEDARKILDMDHAGLAKVKRRIIEQIAVMNLKGTQAGSILLFVGAPGTGKTSIGQSIAKALGRAYVRVSLGGVRDEADIRGHRRTYIGAMPGRIMDGIAKAGVSNPVMVLDEIDKLSQSYNGDPASALLEVLDPEQNHTFTDHYLNVPYDLSDVFFICTANSVDTIPQPLLNRMEVIPFQGYTPLEKMDIAMKHLLRKSLNRVGLTEEQFSIREDAMEQLIAEYTREAGVRGLKKRIDMLARSAAVLIAEGSKQQVEVTPENLAELLDTNPMHQKNVKESANPGIVTGLAWTPVGGDILYIETMLTKGEGKVNVTGQLGDVMKESAQIAVSLVKSMFPEQAEIFKDHDLHIHVPDGATPKDGPSAGITLTTALSSLITGVAVTPQVAMTGEVSLQGTVNPIGGLPEKLMAAQRAGVKKVFIPKDNVQDLKDVAAEVKEALEIVPVERVLEVLQALNILA